MSTARKLIEDLPEDEGRKMAEFCLDGQNCGGEPFQGWTNMATCFFHQYFFQESALVDEWDALRKAGRLTPERVLQLFDHAQREGRMEALDEDADGKVNIPEIMEFEKASSVERDQPTKKGKYGSTEIKPGDLPDKLESQRRIAEARVAPVEPARPVEEPDADALVPNSDATVKVEVEGTAQSVQRAITKLAKKGIKKRVTEAAGSLAPSVDDLDQFTRAYIEAIFFTCGGPDNPDFESKDTSDIAPQTLREIVADCKRFQEENAELYAGGASRGSGEYTADEQAGHDFWLTRNGHGAGFWDGDWPEEVEDKLTKSAKSFGEAEMYVGDDGLIYQFGSEGKRGPGIEGVVVRDDGGDSAEPEYQDSGEFEESARRVVDQLLEDGDEEARYGPDDDDEDEDGDEFEQMRSALQADEAATINHRGDVAFCGKHLGRIGKDFEDSDAAFAALRDAAEKDNFFPNVYWVNDHGNASLYTLDGKYVKSWV